MSMSADGRTVELTRSINYTHHGVTETVEDGQSIEIRCGQKLDDYLERLL